MFNKTREPCLDNILQIPVKKPDISAQELSKASEVMESGWVSSKGKKRKEFETRFSEEFGYETAIALDSGTAALHTALSNLETEGEEIIVQDYTYTSTASAAKMAGYDVSIADVNPNTLSLSTEDLRSKISGQTAAVIVTHIWGLPRNTEELNRICRSNGSALVEDAASSLGSKNSSGPVGKNADFACFSFSWNKPITTGKGGMLVTNPGRREKSEMFADYGHRNGDSSMAETLGPNYLMDSIRSAIGISQISGFKERRSELERVFRCYRQNLPSELLPRFKTSGKRQPELFMIKSGRTGKIQEYLKSNGVETRRPYHPLSMKPLFRQETPANCKQIFKSVLGLPTFPQLSNKQIRQISDMIVNSGY
jgi:dTDP-4-amino-4,6-dideoxygalactose transaminase